MDVSTPLLSEVVLDTVANPMRFAGKALELDVASF